jgi:2-desacetyl-2-hydroxyethyl bacteriochlorophyllide A dehydrogenase
MSVPSNIEVKRIVFPKAHELAFMTETWDPANLEDDQLMMRTRYSLISPGTELAMFTATHIDIDNPDNRWAKLPFYPGYASVGEVIAVGSAVEGIRTGDVVLASGRHASHDIIRCSRDSVCRLPERIDPVHALFACLAEIALTALIHTRYRVGTNVVVLGLGLIGNLAAQLYALQGAESIGADLSDERIKIAESTGFIHAIRSGEPAELRTRIREITGGSDPEIVVEATGAPQLIHTALELVRPHGQVVLLGSPRGTVELNAYRDVHRKGVSLIGAHGSVKGFDGLPASWELTRYALRLIEGRCLAVDPLITHILPAAEARKGYELLLGRQALGVVLDWR